MHTKQDKPEAAKEVLKFFEWAFKNGDQMAAELDYVADAADGGQADRRQVEGHQGRVRQVHLLNAVNMLRRADARRA